ncbi:MAG TPA: iron-containing redox enzyme family protein [Verrucomicrobiae bacterium]|nr:iron-containing redox enzyme family protein [Verrucomicrobiae bacterium]
MDRETFRGQLLDVMDQKKHWAWPVFTSGGVAREKLHFHFEQEYGTYVRDFPVMVGWAYVQCPIAAVRRSLAANLFEEETGGLVAGKPHPELFLEYPRGLGMDLSRFEKVRLLPAAQRYRNFLDEALRRFGWDVSAALATIFIEGTSDERAALGPPAGSALPSLEEHPLVKHYGLAVEYLALTKAHRRVETSHRIAAWQAILENVAPMRRGAVVRVMAEALRQWLLYRDEVAALCGVRTETCGSVGAVA